MNDLDDLASQIDIAVDNGDIDNLSRLDRLCAALVAAGEAPRNAVVWYYRSNIPGALQAFDDPTS